MPNLTITVPEKLKQQMDSLPEMNWSEAIRSFLAEKIRRSMLLKKFDAMLEHSQLTEEQCLQFGNQVKELMLHKYKAKGW